MRKRGNAVTIDAASGVSAAGASAPRRTAPLAAGRWDVLRGTVMMDTARLMGRVSPRNRADYRRGGDIFGPVFGQHVPCPVAEGCNRPLPLYKAASPQRYDQRRPSWTGRGDIEPVL